MDAPASLIVAPMRRSKLHLGSVIRQAPSSRKASEIGKNGAERRRMRGGSEFQCELTGTDHRRQLKKVKESCQNIF
jgi:hypothetical protein